MLGAEGPRLRRGRPTPRASAQSCAYNISAGKVLDYHCRSKHHVDRYAPAPTDVDWAAQPRSNSGARTVPLPRSFTDEEGPSYDSVVSTTTAIEPLPFGADALSRLLYRSLALAAWKEQSPTAAAARRWPVRVNPSSGNLHPTEAYVVCPALDGGGGGAILAQYQPSTHALEVRCAFGAPLFVRLVSNLPPGAFLLCLSTVHWRQVWKYGLRGYRYSHLDAGHALGAVAAAAASLGWTAAALLDSVTAEQASKLMGLPPPRPTDGVLPGRDAGDGGSVVPPELEERPCCVVAIWPTAASSKQQLSPATQSDGLMRLDASAIDEIAATGDWKGPAGAASAVHVPQQYWSWLRQIYDVAAADVEVAETGAAVATAVAAAADCSGNTAQPRAATSSSTCDSVSPSATSASSTYLKQLTRPASTLPFARVARRRRSAVAFDRRASLSLSAFLRILTHCVPHPDCPPGSVLLKRGGGTGVSAAGGTAAASSSISLLLFVHRVEGAQPGAQRFCCTVTTLSFLIDPRSTVLCFP